MPDGTTLPEPRVALPMPSRRRRWVSPLLRRILLLNALPPALLAAALLYLDQYQNGLLAGDVEAMRTQARIYAGAIGEAAVRIENDRVVLVPELAWSNPRPIPRRASSTSPAWWSPIAACEKVPAARW